MLPYLLGECPFLYVAAGGVAAPHSTHTQAMLCLFACVFFVWEAFRVSQARGGDVVY